MRSRDTTEPIAAAVAALAVMGLVASLGLSLVGDARPTAAVVVLATGGAVGVSPGLSTGAMRVGAQAGVELIPLGVTLAGALTLAAVLLIPLRRRPPLDGRTWTRRLGAAGLAFVSGIGLVSQFARGDLRLPEGAGILPHGGTALQYAADLLPTVASGLLWVVVVLAGCLLLSRHSPLFRRLPWWDSHVRPAMSGGLTMLLGTTLLVVLGGIAAAVGTGEPAIAGAALLAAPNVVAIGISRGLGVPWSYDASYPMGGVVPDGLGHVLSGPVPVALPIGALAIVAASAVIAAVLSRGAGMYSARRVTTRAAVFGAIVAATFAVLILLTKASLSVSLSVFGRTLLGTELSVGGDLVAATAIGLGCGMVIGFLGFLAVVLVRSRRRVREAVA